MTANRIALTCLANGKILSVLHDDLQVLSKSKPATMLPSISTPQSRQICFEMLGTLLNEKAVYGWLIELDSNKGPLSLYFAGVFFDESILVVGCEDILDVPAFTEELSYRKDRHISLLRDLVKAKSHLFENIKWFDEMSKLQNQNSEIQRELAIKNVKLEEINRQKNELLGMAAHDLRNPVGAISTFSAALLHEGSGNKEVINEIQGLCQYMSDIIDKFLNYSSIESGKLPITKKLLNLAEILAETIELYKVPAGQDGIEINLDTPSTVLIEIDAYRIQQVLGNLISNAIQHANNQINILVDSKTNDGFVTIRVCDDGAGISEEHKKKIFDIFYQVDSIHSGSPSGFGIGLAIVNKIVRAHGGQVTVASQKPRGSCFTLSLPN